MKLLKYLLLAALSVSLAFTQAGCQKQQTPPTVDLTSEEAIAEQKKFDEFIQSELVASAESDYLTTHIYFEHPENYGIDRSKVEVTPVSYTHLKNAVEDYKKLYEKNY